MSRSIDRVWRDGRDLLIALRCLQTAVPLFWRQVLVAMRRSRRERAHVLRDLRRHPFYPCLLVIHGARTA